MEDFKVNKVEKDEEIAIHADRKELKLIDSQRIIKGLNVFELDLDTFSIRQIVPKEVKVEIAQKFNVVKGKYTKGASSVKRLSYLGRDNCIYMQTINLKNAKKKFTKWLIENGKIDKD